jgi:peptide/nickel transport system permease protein
MATAESTARGRFWSSVHFWLGNWKLVVGVSLILFLLLFSLVGSFFVSFDQTMMGYASLRRPPSWEHPLGTDNLGRDILALMVYGIPASLRIGLVAGIVGTSVGTILGLSSGYIGGRVDGVIRTIADIFLTIPSLVVLVVIAAYVRATTLLLTGLVVAVFAWPGPTRGIRAQTLSMRERGFVSLARLSGLSDLEIVIKQILPNLIPYVAAGFVGSVSGSILASVGIQMLGLGPLHIPNLGMILQFAFQGAALYQGLWWWWGSPAVALIILFIGLFLISVALDELANPRLRQRRE